MTSCRQTVTAETRRIPLNVAPSLRILGFTMAVSLLAAVVFGLAPALQTTRLDLQPALKESGKAAAGSQRIGLGRVLLAGQIALSVLLLIGAGLFIRTLRNLRTLDLGFARENVLQVQIDPRGSGYKRDQFEDLYARALSRVRSIPSVISAGMSGSGFRTGTSRTYCIAVEGTHRAGEDRRIKTNSVTPGYFGTIGMSFVLGRDFGPHDTKAHGPDTSSAIINETMAR